MVTKARTFAPNSKMAEDDKTRRVATQVDFYFSDQNLAQDTFFKDEIAKAADGLVSPLPRKCLLMRGERLTLTRSLAAACPRCAACLS